MRLGGYRLPPVVCIASTNVAESAEVIKKVQISKIARIDKIVPNGICSSIANKAISSPTSLTYWKISVPWKYSRLMADPPKTENQSAPNNVGTKTTHTTNTLTVTARK